MLGSAAPENAKAKDADEYAVEVNALADLGDDIDPDVRTVAMYYLRNFRKAAAPAAERILATAVRRGDAEPRIAAVRTITSVGADPARAAATLAQVLADRDLRLQKVAATALGELGSDAKSALPALETAQKSPDTEVRYLASEAILLIEGAKPAGR